MVRCSGVKPKTKEKTKLKVEKRKITGRKVKTLRRQGFIPANIYGKNVKSLSVQIDSKSFLPVFKEVGESGLVELKVVGEDKPRHILIHNVQPDPITGQPLHVDFYQVSLKEKVTAMVPVGLIGESPAVKEKVGILIQPLNEIEVEALPTELPDKFEVNINGLKEIGNAVTVSDLKVDKEVKILTPSNQILAKIEALAKEEVVTPVMPTPETPTEEAVAPQAVGVEEKTEKEKPTSK